MINTVLGKINAKDLGNILMHEHIGCISNDMMYVFKEKWLDKKKLSDFAAEIFRNLKTKYGVGLIVDGTPIDIGRDVSLIKDVSKRSNIPVVVSTGLYHFPALYTSGRSEIEIASWFISEFTDGIEGTNIKPGILKVASSFDGITKDNKKRLAAMAIAQNETGLPIYVHSEHTDDMSEMQLKILLKHINTPEKIIMGHASRNIDLEYLKKILDKGCYICMDQCHCTNHDIKSVGKVLATLCQIGYTSQIVLSNDICIYSDFGSREHNGYDLTVEQQTVNFGHIFTLVYESFLECGGRKSDWETMFMKNPIEILDV